MRQILLLTLLLPSFAAAQQVSDTAFRPPITNPAHAKDRGPVLLIDEAHHNFHTASGRYLTFANLARADGYRVRGSTQPWSAGVLTSDSARILVVANAVHADNEPGARWRRPIKPAFTPDEIRVVRSWVEQGGSLLLIADHMPMAGAAMELGAAFGIYFIDGFALDTARQGPTVFRRSDGSLGSHAITNGRTRAERIDSVASFTGSAFREDVSLDTLMVLPRTTMILAPEVAWQFNDTTTVKIPGSRALQGAVRKVGRGRVAVFGEAAMFSAQLGGAQRTPMGMNHPMAKQNAQFALNVLHWLSGDLP
jgi:hypothetical protein